MEIGMPQNELKIETLAQGSGPAPRKGQVVTVHYTGWLTDGTGGDLVEDLAAAPPIAHLLGLNQNRRRCFTHRRVSSKRPSVI